MLSIVRDRKSTCIVLSNCVRDVSAGRNACRNHKRSKHLVQERDRQHPWHMDIFSTSNMSHESISLIVQRVLEADKRVVALSALGAVALFKLLTASSSSSSSHVHHSSSSSSSSSLAKPAPPKVPTSIPYVGSAIDFGRAPLDYIKTCLDKVCARWLIWCWWW